MRLTAGQVLALHARTCALYRNPNVVLSEFCTWFMQDAIDSVRGNGAHVMFYDIIPRGTTIVSQEQGERLARRIGADLFTHVTYQVTGPMAVAMMDSQRNLPPIRMLHREEMPAGSGFAWFDEPWLTIDQKDQIQAIRAVTWRLTSERLLTGWRDPRPCIRVALWAHLEDDKDDPRWQQHQRDLRDFARWTGELCPMHVTVIPFGVEFDRPDDPKEQVSVETMLGIFHLLWLWLGMEIVQQEQGKVPRKDAARAHRSLRHQEVRVVTLRKVRHATDPPGTHRDVDWSCQWPVKGHHRHIEKYDATAHRKGHEGIPDPADPQKRCLTCGARTTWVRPHVKGPDGKPLRAADVVYKLARLAAALTALAARSNAHPLLMWMTRMRAARAVRHSPSGNRRRVEAPDRRLRVCAHRRDERLRVRVHGLLPSRVRQRPAGRLLPVVHRPHHGGRERGRGRDRLGHGPEPHRRVRAGALGGECPA